MLYLVFCLSACGQTKNAAVAGNDTTASAATPNFTLIKKIPGNFTSVEVDMLNNIFVVTATGQLKKLSENGDSLAVYNDIKKFGNPSFVDVSNPLKILAFYSNFSTVVVLDRFLSQRNIINFRKENILSVQSVATSYDNNIWLFDNQDFKLKKVDEFGKSLSESNDFRLFVNNPPQPGFIFDNGTYVYLYDAQKGFYVFDYFGTLKIQYNYPGWQNVCIWNGKLYGLSEDRKTLHIFDERMGKLQSFSFPANVAGTSIKFMGGKLVALKSDGLEIFDFK